MILCPGSLPLVRSIAALQEHGYLPHKQEKATQTVLEQAEVLFAGWAACCPRINGRVWRQLAA